MGTKEFNNSLNEIKDFLHFNIVFSDNILNEVILNKYASLLIDSDFLSDSVIKYLNYNINTPKLLITSATNVIKFKNTEIFLRPISINDINKIVVKLDSQKQFTDNSKIKIKDYILDKNEKKLKKNESFTKLCFKKVGFFETPLQKNGCSFERDLKKNK